MTHSFSTLYLDISSLVNYDEYFAILDKWSIRLNPCNIRFVGRKLFEDVHLDWLVGYTRSKWTDSKLIIPTNCAFESYHHNFLPVISKSGAEIHVLPDDDTRQEDILENILKFQQSGCLVTHGKQDANYLILLDGKLCHPASPDTALSPNCTDKELQSLIDTHNVYPKIKVCQLAFGYMAQENSWFQYTKRINEQYCQRHGYAYVADILHDHNQVNRHPHWEKVSHMKRMLVDCDYLLFLDADAIFYGHDLTIENELCSLLKSGKLILISQDGDFAQDKNKTNTGVLLIKNTLQSRAILADWYEITNDPQYQHLKWNYAVEQRAFDEYIQHKHETFVQVQQYHYWQMSSKDGQYIRHFAGSGGRRENLLYQQAHNRLGMEKLPSPPTTYIRYDGKVQMPFVEIDISKGCNLKCEQCTHFSNFRNGVVPTMDIIQQCKNWSEKIHPSEIRVMGGEPLCHPDLKQIIQELRKIWSDSWIHIFTNGVLANNLSQDVMDTIKKLVSFVTVSDHSGDLVPKHNIEDGFNKFKNANIETYWEDARNRWYQIYQLNAQGDPIPYQSDPRKSYGACIAKVCPQLFGNKLYKCSILYGIQAGINENVLSAEDWADALLYQPLEIDASPEQIVEHLRQNAVPSCRVCPEKIVGCKNKQSLRYKKMQPVFNYQASTKCTIIIPVYNTEPYLRECLDSVIGQSLDDIQVICVDDGSTDNSLSILKEYANKDNRIQIIVQEHSGAGTARNNAMQHIKGEYTYFVDSDDVIDRDLCKIAIRHLDSIKGVDFVAFRHNTWHQDGTVQSSPLIIENCEVPTILTDKKDIRKIVDASVIPSTFAVMKTCFLLRHSIRFSTAVPRYEDILFRQLACHAASKVIVLPDILYHYRRRPGTLGEEPHSNLLWQIVDDEVQLLTRHFK